MSGITAFVTMAVSAVTLLGIPLVVPVLVWGGTLFYLNMLDGRAEFADLFAGFSTYGRTVLHMASLMALLMVINLAGQSVQIYGEVVEDEAIFSVGVFVNFIWTILVTLRLTFAYFFMVDQSTGPVESIRAGWRYTKGHLGLVVVLAIACLGIVLVGVLALVVGVIPAIVINYLMWTSAYRQMTGTHASKPPSPEGLGLGLSP